MSRTGKSTETKSRFVFARGWEKEGQGRTVNGYRFSFWGDENVL